MRDSFTINAKGCRRGCCGLRCTKMKVRACLIHGLYGILPSVEEETAERETTLGILVVYIDPDTEVGAIS